MDHGMTEHKFMADFQPLGGPTGWFNIFLGTALNWAAVFGVAYVIGAGLRLGWGS